VGWREFVEMICPTGEAKYFCKRDSTALSTNRPTGKSLDCGERILLSCPGRGLRGSWTNVVCSMMPERLSVTLKKNRNAATV
jgi:hypothetical protein